MHLSTRARGIQPSVTITIDARAKELKAAGEQVINLSAGEPDFPTPRHVREAAKAAIDAGFTRYTPAAGIAELRRAIAEKHRRDNGLEYAEDEIVVSAGGKHALFNAFMAICDPGDQVIIPAPYWVSYPEMVRLAGGEPVIVETGPETGFKLAPEALRRALTPRSRALILNSPSNPTGTVYTRQELDELAAVAAEAGLWMVTDELYEHLIYEGEHVSVAALRPEYRERVILINGVSKAYAMTGWRIGWAAAPRPVARAMAAIQSQATSSVNSIAQKAAVAALTGPQDEVAAMREEYRQRRDLLVEGLLRLPGIEVLRPAGAFYVYPSVRGLLGRRLAGRTAGDDVALAELLLDAARIAVVPGTAFGTPGYLRLSYATSRSDLEEALRRLERLLEGA
ncbi:pyridoxal phosphate-dependent aminotransferase [Thermaerobacter sp. PB12/4term]|uniref:pyridoxal phosphate-dependent aminotransferase n=1 Tax=Thermaerobacter sp. PB12/4term TaxID=2293838 RepID=UPI000E328819|nr:pyridoxal phosphate-dependent aminotransferase [Thermaerobacter sp. PB12/4term]QIA26392.1 pyridoxal phosphate-dependent aminotransferase [Thermaerobacter sp. PB12/4term]